MVTREVVKEIFVNRPKPCFNIFDPGSSLDPVKIQGILDGNWQLRTHTRDFGLKGRHIIKLEAVHRGYVHVYRDLKFNYFDDISDHAQSLTGHLSFLTELSCVLSQDRITTNDYGFSIFSPSLSGYHPIAVSRNSHGQISGIQVDLSHKF